VPKGEENEEKEGNEQVKEAKDKVKTLKEKYIVIEVKNRGKKNFITTVSGLNNFSTSLPMQTWTPRKWRRSAARNSQYPARQWSWERYNYRVTTTRICGSSC
jgi:hypothetical protein